MQIGDKVRFLDDVGGGIIAGFQGKNIALVEDADGFQIPAPINKLVVIEEAVPKEESANIQEEPIVLPRTNIVPSHTSSPGTENEPMVKKVDLPKPVAYRSMMKQCRKDEPLVIDLHAHELLETTAGMSNTEILKYQLRTMRDVLEQHKNNKGQKIVFIHGKGQGVLRHAVVNELKRFFPHLPYQDASFSEYGYGATQVTIR